MTDRESKFRRQLRQFRTLTVVGYAILSLVILGMVVATAKYSGVDLPIPSALPIGLVGLVLVLAVAMPFVYVAYDKTACPYCGKRIEEGHWFWHGIRFNGPTRRYWKLFFGRPLRCPHCDAEVIAAARPESAPYHSGSHFEPADGKQWATVGGGLRPPRSLHGAGS